MAILFIYTIEVIHYGDWATPWISVIEATSKAAHLMPQEGALSERKSTSHYTHESFLYL